MWALRRTANPLREYSIFAARGCCGYSNAAVSGLLHGEGHLGNFCVTESSVPSKLVFSHGRFTSFKFLFWSRNLSSEAGAKSGDQEDDLGDGFSDLEVPPEDDKVGDLSDVEADEDLTAEGDVSGEDSDSDPSNESNFAGVGYRNPFVRLVLETPLKSFTSALNKWVAEGNEIGRSEISMVNLSLRQRRLYAKALKFVEWLEAEKHIELIERDYVSHLDLIAKVYGLQKAEKYIEIVPEAFRGEMLYRTLLANCVAVVNVSKAEQLFNKMKDLGFPRTTFTFNQLLLLYKRVDRKKISDVLKMMEEENVKPSMFTYRILIDTKGRANDIMGMESILERMEADGIKPDLYVQGLVARYYIHAGLNEKAKKVLEDMEGDDIKENREARWQLLQLYGALGNADDIARIWSACEANPSLAECSAAIEAWGKIGKVENAEEVFEKMSKKWKKLSAKHYNTMLKVYANHKLLDKGTELAKQMANSGCRIGPFTWDAIVRLYIKSGDVQKADSILQKATRNNKDKPLYSTFMAVLDHYAIKGDIHNAEKIFYKLRQCGYVGRLTQYQSLLQAYISAKAPAYGFRERMKADNIFPNRAVAAMLADADAFKKTELSELLD